MHADAPLQAWLDLQSAERQVIAPYVRSPLHTTLTYDLRVVRSGPGGHTQTRQSGQLQVAAGQATPLGTRLLINISQPGSCSIELLIRAYGQPARRFVFACPGQTPAHDP